MKRVLVTGGAGFIGANAARAFLAEGNETHVAERAGCDLWRLEDIKEKVGIHTLDIASYEEVASFIANLKPDIILHFAAYGASQGTQQDIEQTINTNLLGTINLVNACAKVGFRAFIHTGSSSEYGIKDKPMKESDLLEAHNLYGITKAAATLYCQAFAKKYDLPLAIMRPFSPYGAFEDSKRLIPTVITSCLKKSALHLSSPESVRDFVFIEDLIAAYQAAIEHIQEVKGEIFNVGGGVEHTVQEVVDTVKNIIGSEVQPEYGQVKPNQEEPAHWVADISKAKKLLHWEPKYPIEKGLEKTVAWFRI